MATGNFSDRLKDLKQQADESGLKEKRDNQVFKGRMAKNARC